MGKFRDRIPTPMKIHTDNPLNKPELNPSAKALVAMINGWMTYAQQYRQRYGSRIGSDDAQKTAWVNIGISLLDLIDDGDTGDLNVGRIHSLVQETLEKEGL